MVWLVMAWVVRSGAIEPIEPIEPIAMTSDAPSRYAAWQGERGPPADELHCDTVWSDAIDVCYRARGGATPRWMHRSDVAALRGGADGLRSRVDVEAAAVVGRAAWVRVGGMAHRYLSLTTPDGWAVAGLLRPDVLSKRLGGVPIRVAMPAQGLLVAWKPSCFELDRVMAVGVRELYEEQPRRLSPKVFQWDGTSWSAFGQAVPRP